MMTYAPNIFSTKAGLSRPVVFQWIEAHDTATIQRWLIEGDPHARLATEGIAHALRHGHVDVAEMIWQAGWHKPKMVFDAACHELRFAWYDLCRGGAQSQLTQPAYERAIDWLLDKTNTPGAKGPQAKIENAGRIAGLQMAFDTKNEAVWDKIIKTGPDLSAAEANELFRHMAMRLSFWPNEFAHARDPAPEWIEQRALSDFFSHGFRPGGSIWVGAATHECARPLLDYLRAHASTLTTPRLRTAILIHAAENNCPGIDELMSILVPLGVPEEITLTASEIKRVRGYATSGVYLEDRAADHAFTKFVWRPHRDSEFSADNATEPASLKSALGEERWTLFKRDHLMAKADQVTTAPRPALRPRGM